MYQIIFLIIYSITLIIDHTSTYRQVDLIERNRVYTLVDGKWHQTLDQYIYWDYTWDGLYVVEDWKQVSKVGETTKRVDFFFQEWVEGRRKVVVESRCYIETWSTYDPEIRNRDLLPEAKRRKL